jgi:hypothetical protein
MQRRRILAACVVASLGVGASSVGFVGSASAAPTPTPHALKTEAVATAALRARIDGVAAQARAAAVNALAAPVPPMTIHDPVGDVPSTHGDITGAGMLQNSSGTGFAMTVKAPSNPLADATWVAGKAEALWLIDAQGSPDFDYLVLMFVSATSGHLIAGVTTAGLSPTVLCLATPTFVPRVGYRVSVPAGCLPHLTTVRFGAWLLYGGLINDPNPPIDFAPDNGPTGPVLVQQKVHDGYWMLGSDGHVYPFGGAVGFGGLAPGAVAMAPRRDGAGYWVVDASGSVFAYGTAHFFGGGPALGAGESVRTISATPNGGGYWLFTNKGRAFPFGNAQAFGDMTGVALNGPIVASVATASGKGYYMVGSDGGIFSFGDARFHGSTGNIRLNKPVVGMSPTPDGKGYWLVASDGGVFAFAAPFRGSMGGTKLNRPVDGLVAFGNGYLMAASDGGIFDFSNKAFYGSLADSPPSSPIIGLAAFSS